MDVVLELLSTTAVLVTAVVVGYGVYIARRTLVLDRFRTAANLFSSHSHVSRYLGALRLAELWEEESEQYRDTVKKSFFAFLKHPPFFADTASKAVKETDYESIDLVEVVNFLNSRPRCERECYPQLPHGTSFKIDDDFCVVPDPGNHSYDAWLQRMGGREPEYDPCDRQG